jgi:predicted TPR repeat methyltransferase
MPLSASYAAAEALYQASQWRDAIAAYRAIVAAHPLETRAWALMGLCATQAGDLPLAAQSLRHAALLDPSAANVFFRLGIVLYQQGRADEAEVAFKRTVALDPQNIDAQQNLAAMLMEQGRPKDARPLFEAILKQRPDFELAWAGLANIHAGTGDRASMVACLERALAINPGNAATRHLLAAAKGDNPTHPDWRYVETFFDDYAARFEAHLVERLEYAGPQRLMAMIGKTGAQPESALDLGCGTGLFGAAVRAAFPDASIIGVDLSQRMVDAAAARGVYARVEKAEAEDYLRRTSLTFDLIAATDVFIYVGDIAELVREAYHHLTPGGLLAFTAETTDAPGFQLQPTGRYAHNRDDLLALAAQTQFNVLAEERAPLRRHAGQMEEGLYLILQRP